MTEYFADVTSPSLTADSLTNNTNPVPVSGQQELIENIINRTIERIR